MSLPVAILAGGRATRLGSIAARVPKALVEVAGKPFAFHQLDLLRTQGVTDVVYCVGHLAEAIVDTLGDGRDLGLRIAYVFDGPEPLGTGGALRAAVPVLGKRFLVMYGDSYLACDFRAVERAFVEAGVQGLMTVFRNDDQWDRSNVVFEHGRIVRYDKTDRSDRMRHIDYGLGALRAEALEPYPERAALDLTTVYRDLLARGQLAGFEVTERFHEVGSPEGLAETRRFLQRRVS